MLTHPEERVIFRIAQSFWQRKIDFSVSDIETALHQLIERLEFGSTSQNYQNAIEFLDELYAREPIEVNPGRKAAELLAAPKRASPLAAPRLFRCSETIGEVTQEASDAHEARVSGTLRVGHRFKALDEKIGGALPKVGTCIVLGNTGTRKTAFTMQIAAT